MCTHARTANIDKNTVWYYLFVIALLDFVWAYVCVAGETKRPWKKKEIKINANLMPLCLHQHVMFQERWHESSKKNTLHIKGKFIHIFYLDYLE